MRLWSIAKLYELFNHRREVVVHAYKGEDGVNVANDGAAIISNADNHYGFCKNASFLSDLEVGPASRQACMVANGRVFERRKRI